MTKKGNSEHFHETRIFVIESAVNTHIMRANTHYPESHTGFHWSFTPFARHAATSCGLLLMALGTHSTFSFSEALTAIAFAIAVAPASPILFPFNV